MGLTMVNLGAPELLLVITSVLVLVGRPVGVLVWTLVGRPMAKLVYTYRLGGWLMERARPVRCRQALEMTARRLAEVAVVIGGQARAWRAEEFLANLTQPDTTGTSPSGWRQLRHAAGLIRAALRMRAHDLTRPFLRLLDWSLAKPRSEWIVTWLTTATAVYFWRAKGFHGLMEQLQNIATVAALIGPALWLRKHRDIPPARTPRHDEHHDTEPNSTRR